MGVSRGVFLITVSLTEAKLTMKIEINYRL